MQETQKLEMICQNIQIHLGWYFQISFFQISFFFQIIPKFSRWQNLKKLQGDQFNCIGVSMI